MGASLGYQMGLPERRVVNFIGDGCFQVTAVVGALPFHPRCHDLLNQCHVHLLLFKDAVPDWQCKRSTSFFQSHMVLQRIESLNAHSSS